MEGRENMANFNGKGPRYCKFCDGEGGIHRADDLACPVNGEDQTGNKNPGYLEGFHFEPQEWQTEIEKAEFQKKTIFDEYFIAALNCASNILDTPETLNELKEANEIIVTWAYDLATSALVQRDHYLKTAGRTEK